MKFLPHTLLALLLSLMSFGSMAQSVTYQGIRQDIVVDVRTSIEFAMGHIPGAVNVPLGDIEKHGFRLEGINRNSRILLYCRSGQRSETARALLEKQGFKHVVNGGGMRNLESALKSCATKYC